MEGRAENKLPVELWIMIFDMVVDSCMGYTDCTSTNFPQLLHRWKNQEFDTNTEWKQFRLVCRTWSIILGKPQQLRITSYDDLIKASNVQSLAIYDKIAWPRRKVKPYPLNQDLLRIAEGITNVSILKRIEYNSRAREPFFDFLIEHSLYFKNLKALSLEVACYLEPDFWSGLEKSFPNLVSLRVAGVSPYLHKGDGHITLPKLKILELGLRIAPEGYFPSLEHLSISSPSLEFLQQHAPRLKSVIAPFYLNLEHSPRRITFPRLELFGGIGYTTLSKATNPSLQHVYIIDPSICFELTTHIPEIMAEFPNLRYVTFDHRSVPSSTVYSVRKA